MTNYIIAEPYTGRPTVNRVFIDYDVAKFAARTGEIVTNANFSARKGHNAPKRVTSLRWPVKRPLFRKILQHAKRVA